MVTGNNGIDLIKKSEGCELDAYLDAVGIWTIGYGHTGTVDGKAICFGMVITQDEAIELLKADLRKFEKSVEELVTTEINQNQFDALVSFTYNVGPGNLKKSTLLKKVNTDDFNGAAEEFLKWNKAGGRVLNGLTTRREAEKKLFLEKCTTDKKPKKDNEEETQEPKKELFGKVNTSALNIRKSASASSQILETIVEGTKITILEKGEFWHKVQHGSITGYSSAKYITIL
jgi:GH24 family phage-related lysozyme (muramidase)